MVLSVIAGAGCGGVSDAPARDDVFYLHQRGAIDSDGGWERYFPPLDRAASPRLPQRVGVAVLDGRVAFARPIDWQLVSADDTPSQRRVSYQSPRQFLFNLYERTDPPGATWKQVLKRFEDDARATGTKIISGARPVASANAQGRTYTLQTPGRGSQTLSREILLRSSNRIVLVQIVHGAGYNTNSDEMIDAVRSMLVY